MKRVVVLSLLALLFLVIFSSFFWFQEVKYFRTRADVSKASFSVDNSYLFVSPLKAQANGLEKVRLTAFVLNNQGIGVLGKRVTVSGNKSLKIENIQAITDQYGKAVFDISATAKSECYLDVQVEGQNLKQQAHVSFY